MTASIAPAQLWIIEPPGGSPALASALGHLLNAGVDFAFGENESLPNEPPETLDGVRVILVCLEDLPRVQRRLRGFRGFHPDLDPPFDYAQAGQKDWTARDLAAKREEFLAWITPVFLHENDRTWLAVYGREALAFWNRIECPLLLIGDLTLKSLPMRQRLLARPDSAIRDLWISSVLRSTRQTWGDIAFNDIKQLLDDYEITGDAACLEAARTRMSGLLASGPPRADGGHLFPAALLGRLAAMTRDDRFLAPIPRLAEAALDSIHCRPGSIGLCHAEASLSPATRQHLLAQGAGDMGSYAELMASTYLPLIAMAPHTKRQREIVDLVALCVKTLRDNLRDPGTGLFWHGLPARWAGHTGFMGHGVGWSAFGLAQILDLFPADHPERAALVDIFRDLCAAAARWQDADGAFHHILNDPLTLVSLHYTGWLGYAFLHGARMGYLDQTCLGRGRRAWEALKARTFRGGVIAAAGGSPVSRNMDFYMERFGQLNRAKFASGGGSQALFLLHEIMRTHPASAGLHP